MHVWVWQDLLDSVIALEEVNGGGTELGVLWKKDVANDCQFDSITALGDATVCNAYGKAITSRSEKVTAAFEQFQAAHDLICFRRS
jgi:hypothetical protein